MTSPADPPQDAVTAAVTGMILAAAAGRFADAEYLLSGLAVADYPVALRQLVFMVIAILRGADLTDDDVQKLFSAAALTVARGDDSGTASSQAGAGT